MTSFVLNAKAMESLFLHNIGMMGALIYPIVFFLLFFEGEGVVFVATYIAYHGHISLYVLVPVVILGVACNDIVWFRFGGVLQARSSLIRRWVAKCSTTLCSHLDKHVFHTLLVAKFAYGLNRATIMCAGARLPFLRFLLPDAIAIIIWTAFIVAAGYLSASGMSLIKPYLKYAEIGVLIGILVLFGVTHLITKYGIRGIEHEEN